MIKAGNVSVGDKIQMEDFIPASKEVSPEADIPVNASADVSAENDKEYIPAQSPAIETQEGIAGIPGGVVFNNPSNSNSSDNNSDGANEQGGRNTGTSPRWYQAPIYGINAANSQTSKVDPLPYSQMTQYLDNVSLRGSMSEPSIVMPQAPMTPNGYDEEINYDSIQAFNGFLRTQIGRYMRIEQLIGSNTIEDRFGFLVGVGSNFIILQEITTGNIMVLDIFSIRLTYIYYSPPVIPNL